LPGIQEYPQGLSNLETNRHSEVHAKGLHGQAVATKRRARVRLIEAEAISLKRCAVGARTQQLRKERGANSADLVAGQVSAVVSGRRSRSGIG
jgi:hypothetical protein